MWLDRGIDRRFDDRTAKQIGPHLIGLSESFGSLRRERKSSTNARKRESVGRPVPVDAPLAENRGDFGVGFRSPRERFEGGEWIDERAGLGEAHEYWPAV